MHEFMISNLSSNSKLNQRCQPASETEEREGKKREREISHGARRNRGCEKASIKKNDASDEFHTCM